MASIKKPPFELADIFREHGPAYLQKYGERMQSALLLPVTYFMLTFTLPDTLNAVARSNQAFIYSLFFQTAAAALQKLARDPQFVGGQLGFFGVLQTWARDLAYHPHLHFKEVLNVEPAATEPTDAAGTEAPEECEAHVMRCPKCGGAMKLVGEITPKRTRSPCLP
ncbi:MAG: transposase [Candidatus Nitrosotenuis sp.]